MLEQFESMLVFKKTTNSLIQELQQEKLPLVLWGGGDVSSAVREYLIKNRIVVSAIWIDPQWQSETEIDGIPVASLESIKEKYERFNVILGHSHYDLGRKVLQEETQIRKIYYCVSNSYGQYENIPTDFVKKHLEEYYQTYCLLEDAESRAALAAYLNARMNNDIQYIEMCYDHEQTFFHNDIFRVSHNESYLDIGAFDGDTIRLFLEECEKEYNKIFAFEPEDVAFQKLKNFVQNEKLHDVILFHVGTWNQKGNLYFKVTENQLSTISMTGRDKEKTQIKVDALDHILKDDITMIKINFMQGVLETLEGAEEILKKGPKLAITVGFEEWNLIRIPQYIKRIMPDYRIYLRFNRCMPACLTMYAQVGNS